MTLEQHLNDVLDKARALYKEPPLYQPQTRYMELRESIFAFYNKAARLKTEVDIRE